MSGQPMGNTNRRPTTIVHLSSVLTPPIVVVILPLEFGRVLPLALHAAVLITNGFTWFVHGLAVAGSRRPEALA